jgi:hypothetical protein
MKTEYDKSGFLMKISIIPRCKVEYATYSIHKNGKLTSMSGEYYDIKINQQLQAYQETALKSCQSYRRFKILMGKS